MVGVRGREVDRVNKGRLGPKGLYGWQANNSKDRLTRPLVRRNGRLEEADWDTAMELIVEQANSLVEEKTGSSIGFYTTGQLFLEDYYTLCLMARVGIGTLHVDGNTRMCTATADAALKASFGSDGDPGSYADFDTTEAIFLFGHNVSETQTVLWSRMLDRLRGPKPPKLVVVDPRPTPAAREADLHIPIRSGTNLPFMNALLNELITNGWIDEEYVAQHTTGFKDVKEVARSYTPESVAEICQVPADQIRAAARIFGTTNRVVSTVLQGFYQSHQASASAIQVNNLHLLRGMIGKPGCGVLQMNGQPTAQNTREAGANGDLPGAHNWQNKSHVDRLAKFWNVEPERIPTWAEPTHAMQIFRYAETGSIGMLWIVGTNPAVSLPELTRIRRILGKSHLFLVVQDAFMTETAAYADVVLPAAIWGEKTGVFTNADRTVHISDQAVDPPGEARPDMDIFLDFARRMGFKDKDGEPLIKWTDPQSCFEAFKEITKDRPCDYSGITYDKLRGGSGIQWPCNREAPEGTERLYTDGVFNTSVDYCEDYGHDLETGGVVTEDEYRSQDPAGKAKLLGAHYSSPLETTSDRYPFLLTTGRTAYHFHTRTKTGRAKQLQDAAPEPWIEISESDAAKVDISEGDLVRVESPRGAMEALARVSPIKEGMLFAPFHFGYFDTSDGRAPNGSARAANELTITAWDPVSKQPYFKHAAVSLRLVEKRHKPSAAPTTTASAPTSDAVGPTTGGGPEAAASSEVRS